MNENSIKKKKSLLPVIIIAAVFAILCAVVYFMLFTRTAKDAREIKLHLANAEKFLDDLDYESAIAEYEAVLKLNPEDKDTLEAYVDAVFAYAEIAAEDDPEEAAKILADAARFLDDIADNDRSIEENVENLWAKYEEYKQIVNSDSNVENAADNSDDGTSVNIDNDDQNYKENSDAFFVLIICNAGLTVSAVE